jgi:hypothetical protein
VHRSGASLAVLRVRFADLASSVWVLYVVGLDGAVEQCVVDADTAFHAGRMSLTSAGLKAHSKPNFCTVGIEHEAWRRGAGRSRRPTRRRPSLRN